MPSTRRQFLQFTSAALAAATLPRLHAAAAKGKARPIGFSLYGMKALPVLDALDHCKRIGYDNVELCLMKDFPTELGKFSPAAQRDVRDRLRSTGLELSSLLVHIDLTAAQQGPAIEVIKGAGEIARQLDDRSPPLIESVTGGKADAWEATKEQLVGNMRRWAETAGPMGVKIAVKAHYGQVINSPDRLLWLYKRVNHPAFTLTYDYSHFQAEGFELEPTLRAVIPHTGFIHMKDLVVGEKPAKYLLVGEGKIDYVKYFRLLRELKYAGPILVEVSAQIHNRPGYEPVPTAEKCYAFLSRSLQASIA
ncbi:MAG: sugar phosphate isomerase/epimerase [Opitutus sp.]|nr:sugar phosphate isomerase/epimerase [Opitutus sp.]